VNNKFRVFQELKQLIKNLFKARLVHKALISQPVNFNGPRVDLTLGV